jgi:GTPase Era involved in 16S rRNA processing
MAFQFLRSAYPLPRRPRRRAAGKAAPINAVVGQKLSTATFEPPPTRHRVAGIASDTDHEMILSGTRGIMHAQVGALSFRLPCTQLH